MWDSRDTVALYRPRKEKSLCRKQDPQLVREAILTFTQQLPPLPGCHLWRSGELVMLRTHSPANMHPHQSL